MLMGKVVNFIEVKMKVDSKEPKKEEWESTKTRAKQGGVPNNMRGKKKKEEMHIVVVEKSS